MKLINKLYLHILNKVTVLLLFKAHTIQAHTIIFDFFNWH